MKCLILGNELQLDIGDRLYVSVDGNVFGESKVVDKDEESNNIGVTLPIDALEYIENVEFSDRVISYKVIPLNN